MSHKKKSRFIDTAAEDSDGNTDNNSDEEVDNGTDLDGMIDDTVEDTFDHASFDRDRNEASEQPYDVDKTNDAHKNQTDVVEKTKKPKKIRKIIKKTNKEVIELVEVEKPKKLSKITKKKKKQVEDMDELEQVEKPKKISKITKKKKKQVEDMDELENVEKPKKLRKITEKKKKQVDDIVDIEEVEDIEEAEIVGEGHKTKVGKNEYRDPFSIEGSDLAQAAQVNFRLRNFTNPRTSLVAGIADKINFRSHFLTGSVDQITLSKLNPVDLSRILNEFYTESKSAISEIDPREAFHVFFDISNDGVHLTPEFLRDKVLTKFYHGLFYLMRLCRNANVIGNESDDTILESRKFDHIFKILRWGGDHLVNDMRLRILTDEKVCHDDTIDIFNIVPHDPEKQTSWQRLLIFLLNRLCDYGYRRYNGSCYQQIRIAFCYDNDGNTFYCDYDSLASIHERGSHNLCGVYETHSWKCVNTISQVIYQMVDKNTDYERWQDLTASFGNSKSSVHYLENCIDPEFPELRPNRLARSFTNGILILEQGIEEFFTFAYKPDLPNDLVCCKHYDLEFDTEIWDTSHWWYMDTPQFTKILTDQHLPPPVQAVFYAMMGRLLYKVNAVDKWQVIFFIRGVAQSGKSTIGNIAKMFFDATDVAIMSSNIEQKFGLDPISRKMLFICYEVTKSWSLPRADFQSLISGEELSIAGKHKEARTIKWDVPGLLLGNELGPWVDSAGSMVRRLMVAEFEHRIHESDPDMERKILQELPTLIFKCQQAYLAYYGNYGNHGIWERIPQYFRGVQSKLSACMNPIKEFLKTSPSIYRSPVAFMPHYMFDTLFADFARTRSYKVHFTQDDYKLVFEEMGLKTKNMTEDWEGKRFRGTYIIGLGVSDNASNDQVDDGEDEKDPEIENTEKQEKENKEFKDSLPPADIHSLTRSVCDNFPISKLNHYHQDYVLLTAERVEENDNEMENDIEYNYLGDEVPIYSMSHIQSLEQKEESKLEEVEEDTEQKEDVFQTQLSFKIPAMTRIVNLGNIKSSDRGFRMSDIVEV